MPSSTDPMQWKDVSGRTHRNQSRPSGIYHQHEHPGHHHALDSGSHVLPRYQSKKSDRKSLIPLTPLWDPGGEEIQKERSGTEN